jgi:carboxypeptidase family protein
MSRALRKGLLGTALAGLAVLCCLAPPEASAQAVTGTILGVVKDSQGAVVPGATVTLLNTGTGFTRTVVTDAHGEYTAPSIPTGTYSVTAEITGFKKVAKTNVQVSVDQKVKIDIALELGAMEEVVEIQAETPLLNTSSSDLGQTVVEDQIKTLPLNGRNFVSLTRTIPGVARGIPGANIDGAGSLAWRASAAFSAMGQRPRDNNYMLDGVDNNETWLQTVVIFPSVDALEEFKLQTSTYSAEFGRSLGGVVNLQLKSGTNQYHGSVYDFLRNDAFDANNWFNNRAKNKKPDFKQNQFGATLGGPIFKDKTFFFADYQGLRINAGQTYLSTVPTDKMRNGDFSELSRVIYDPTTGQPFPGNVIPQSRQDPASKNILNQLYPEPNTAGTIAASGQNINNYLITPTLERQDNQFDVKVDHRLTTNNRFFVRYSYQKTHRFLPATLEHGDAGTTFGAGDGNIKAQSVTFNDTHTFSPTLLNEFRFGWNSIKFFMTPLDYGENLAQAMGIPGINLGDPTNSAMTQLNFQNIRNLGANSNQPLITNQNDFQLFDNVTKIAGRHTFKFGGSVTFRSREILNADTIVGNFGFNNNMTSNCAGTVSGCTVNSSTGFDVASFLLGAATTKTRNLFDAGTYTEKRPEWSVYAQDDFRVSSKLTLNLGLRYDIYVPWVEVNNQQSNFDESTGKFVVAADNAVLDGINVGRYLQTYSKADVGPRFGFAYDLFGTGRTLIRGGVGVFWNYTPGGTSSSKAQNPPFLQSTALTAAPNTNFSANDPKMQVSAGLPAPPGVDPTRPPSGTTRSIFNVDFRDAYTVNFNLNLQQQIGQNYMVELAAVGARGRQYLLKDNPNEAPAVVGVTNNNINRPYFTISPALRDVGQVQSDGVLNYYGFLGKIQRRFANGISLLGSYTFAKALDYNSDNDGLVTVLNVYNIAGYNYGLADYNVAHTVSVSGMYELPFGKSKWYGGWQFSGIYYWRTGLPRTVTQQQGLLSTAIGNRPNTVGSPYISDPTVEKWFDPTAYAVTTDNTGTFGDTGRNTFIGPKQSNLDMSLIKYTRIGKTNLELRCEAFNVMNHPQFQAPNTTIGNASVGQITAMLQNPACALCGTTERNIQFAAKITF